jgi:hypothetical protein
MILKYHKYTWLMAIPNLTHIVVSQKILNNADPSLFSSDEKKEACIPSFWIKTYFQNSETNKVNTNI